MSRFFSVQIMSRQTFKDIYTVKGLSFNFSFQEENRTPPPVAPIQRIRNTDYILTRTTFLNDGRATSVILSVGLIVFSKLYSP